MIRRRRRRVMRRMSRRSTLRMRRTTRRTRSVGSIVKRRNTSEVKYLTYYDYNKLVPNTERISGATSELYSGCQFATNIMKNIVQGTGDNQRVGDRIYVKYIDFKVMIKPCLQSDAWKPCDFVYRIFIHTANVAAGAVVSNFFKGNLLIPITHGWPDRSQRNIYYDKMVMALSTSGGTPVPVTVAKPGDAYSSMRYVTFRIPVGRQVTFKSDGEPKEARDCISFSVMGYGPRDDQDRLGWQTACMDYTYRIYYTDT